MTRDGTWRAHPRTALRAGGPPVRARDRPISVVDFSDLSNIEEIAYADPKPINPTALTVSGDWSSHYYNGLIYQSDITRGLLAWEIKGNALGGTKHLNRLNPQTQEFTTG